MFSSLSTREPTIVRTTVVAFVVAGLNVAVAFGVPISQEQMTVINSFLIAGGALMTILWVRPAVTPVDDPNLPGMSDAEGLLYPAPDHDDELDTDYDPDTMWADEPATYPDEEN